MAKRATKKRPSKKHKELYDDLFNVLTKYDGMPPAEMLAVTANLCGALITMLDPQEHNSDTAMDIVCQNLVIGNGQMIEATDQIGEPRGNA